MADDVAAAWWERKKIRDGGKIASAAWAAVELQKTTYRTLELQDQIWQAIYTGRPVGSSGRRITRTILVNAATGARLDFNINLTQSKIDALTSRMSKHKVLPVIGVNGAGYTKGRMARAASEQMRGKMSTPAVQREKPLVHRDSMIAGTGVMGVFRRGGDCEVRRIQRRHIVVGDRDGQEGRPRSLFHLHSMPLEEAIAEWPDAEAALRAESGTHDHEDVMVQPALPDGDRRVTVLRAYHLPSSPSAKDGRYTACLKERTLEDREHKAPRMPYAFIHWIAPVEGFWGMGLVEVLLSLQAALNRMARNINEATEFAAALTIFKPRGSSIPNEHLVGKQQRVVEYDGNVPTYIAPVVVSPSEFQFFERVIALFDDLSGLARDYSTGQTQLGANVSGRAVGMLDDIQSDRFAQYLQQDTAFMLDLGYAIMDVGRDIWERKDELKIAAPAKWIKDFAWAKIPLDGSDDFELKFEPENFLSSTRAGRLAGINELAAGGAIDPTEAMIDTFDEPDMQRLLRSKMGKKRVIQATLDALHDLGIPLYELSPHPAYFPLDEAIPAALNEFNLATADKAEDEVLDRIDQWIQLAKEAKKTRASGEAAEAPPPGAPGEMPIDPAAAPLDPLAQGGLPAVDDMSQLGALPPDPMAGGVAPPLLQM